MWIKYEPYADTNFGKAFALDPDHHFWEMYLTLAMLDRHKMKVCRRAELTLAQRDKGPDICIGKGNRRIWIEAMAPEHGDDEENPDRVPKLKPGLNDPKDNLASLQSRADSSHWKPPGAFLPHALSAVYPIGDEMTTLDPKTGQVQTRCVYSAEIERTKGEKPEDPDREDAVRTAFRNDDYKSISGLI
jgi:hypothetical protein